MTAPVKVDCDRKNQIIADNMYAVHISEIYFSFL